MEKRKISLVTVITIFIVALIIGCGLGYVVYKEINNKVEPVIAEGQENIQKFEDNDKNKVEKENTNIETEIINNESNINIIEDNINYDGSKTIIINGKIYTISYISENFENFNNSEIRQTEVKLYMNNKYIGTANLNNIMDINHVYGNKDYDVELHKISEDYVLIVLKTEYNDGVNGAMSRRIFFIVNKDGIHIDTLEWFNSTHIIDKKDNKELKYEIDNEGIILYQVNGNVVMKNKYIPVRDIIKKLNLEVLDENKVELAGK